jgi:small subunit ribosomal protein S8
VFESEGYIIDYKVTSFENKSNLHISLKYSSGNPVISSITQSYLNYRRIFSRADSLPKVNNGLGIAIISTPKGVMTDIDARKQKVGGEIICKVF